MIQNNSYILRSNVYCQDAVRSYAERSGYRHHLFYSRSRLKWTKVGGLQAKFNDKGFLSRDISVKEMIEHRGDIHHVFPRQYLKENGISQSQYNQVANYVYVQQEINIKVGKRSPADYIGQIREQCQSGKLAFGGIDTFPDFEATLEANCIPGNIYEMRLKDYEDFLGDRRVLMAQKIKRYYQNL